MMVYLDNVFNVAPAGAVDERAIDERAIDGRSVDGGIPVGGFTPIGWQARGIIDSILEDNSPEMAEVHWRLRRSLATHPGSPEQALLAHLMETTERVNNRTG